eukprot:CAMPEP_0114522828 /NCGR_PEP_ID=MMETSP0109-20121206/20954_1 /TAXON_ID=29199 /ORGANISM="Chlorarachnion reptans, Strain CCCM449" /LENGTH=88 /DNA_ID=CAMNT_0001704079 /DNA_START=477 /DNA_END=743 /DNA_ORIENTATION=+
MAREISLCLSESSEVFGYPLSEAVLHYLSEPVVVQLGGIDFGKPFAATLALHSEAVQPFSESMPIGSLGSLLGLRLEMVSLALLLREQ